MKSFKNSCYASGVDSSSVRAVPSIHEVFKIQLVYWCCCTCALNMVLIYLLPKWVSIRKFYSQDFLHILRYLGIGIGKIMEKVRKIPTVSIRDFFGHQAYFPPICQIFKCQEI